MTLQGWLEANRFKWLIHEDNGALLVMRNNQYLQISIDMLSTVGGMDSSLALSLIPTIRDQFEQHRDTHVSIQEALDKRHEFVL